MSFNPVEKILGDKYSYDKNKYSEEELIAAGQCPKCGRFGSEYSNSGEGSGNFKRHVEIVCKNKNMFIQWIHFPI